MVFVLIGRRVAVPRIVVGLLILSLVWRLAFVLSNPVPPTFYDGPFLVWVFGFSLPRYFEWSLGALLAWAIANGKTLAFVLPGRAGALVGARPRVVFALGIGFILAGAASLLRAQIKYLIEDPCYSTGWFLIASATLLPSTASGSRFVSAGVATIRRWAAARLQGLGRRSFSVYLLHEVVLFVVTGLKQRFQLPALVAVPAACGLIWAVCYPFYRYAEAPFERRSKMVGLRRTTPSLLITPDPQT